MEFLQNNILTDFFVFCLKGLETVFNDYALSIVVLTILIRLAMLPLDMKTRNNQAKMAMLQPQLASLQKRYGNNPPLLQKKQKELYAQSGYKPLLGCIPMLITLPFLFAFFGAMRVLATEQMVGMILDGAQFGVESVKLPSFFWVHNFWQADSGIVNILPNAQEFMTFIQSNASNITPETMQLLRSINVLNYSDSVMTINEEVYNNLAGGILRANDLVGYKNGWFILPALCGVGLFLQQKFAPQQQSMQMVAQDEETQKAQGCNQKMMLWFMPLFSVYICAQSSSTTAFALYWFVSSAYAFAQQQIIALIEKSRDKKNKSVTVS